jgi:two-component system, response regulator PdtaR
VANAARPSPKLRPSTILLVEDEILIRLWIAPELRAAGFSVIEAATADDALAVLNTGQQVDLLMTDVRMPGSMDGTKLAALVRSTWPNVKIVVASAHASDRPVAITDAFFDKPYFSEQLVQRVRDLVGAD